MSESFLKVGDVVKLRSGGADMVVKYVVLNTASAVCVWHATDFGPCEREYPFEVLDRVVR